MLGSSGAGGLVTDQAMKKEVSSVSALLPRALRGTCPTAVSQGRLGYLPAFEQPHQACSLEVQRDTWTELFLQSKQSKD